MDERKVLEIKMKN